MVSTHQNPRFLMMRRSTLLACLLLLMGAFSARAQDYSFGLRVGLSTTTLEGTSDTDLAWRSAFTGGFTFGATFLNSVTIQPEILYVVKGASTDNVFLSGEPTGLEAIFSISYIDFPLLVYYSPFQRSTIYPKVFAGPVVSWQLEASVETTNPANGNSQKESDDSVDGSDYGVVVGAGVDFDFRGERITFDTRYIFGQSNIRSSRPDAPLHNRGLLFLLGVSF